MVLFRGLRHMRGPLVRGSSKSERFTRAMALVLVVLITILAFQWNIERRMQQFQVRETVSDATNTLTDEQKRALAEFSNLFREEFGMEVRLQVAVGEITPPAPDPSIIFLGINPQTQAVVLQVPPLAARAMGPEVLRQIQQEHFPPYFRDGTWPQGLVLAMSTMWDTLINQSAMAPS